MRSKLHLISFLIVFAAFGAANYYSYVRMVPKDDWGLCEQCFISFGFPFAVAVAGGSVSKHFLWYGIIGDVGIAILCGIILGWVLTKLFRRVSRTANDGAA